MKNNLKKLIKAKFSYVEFAEKMWSESSKNLDEQGLKNKVYLWTKKQAFKIEELYKAMSFLECDMQDMFPQEKEINVPDGCGFRFIRIGKILAVSNPNDGDNALEEGPSSAIVNNTKYLPFIEKAPELYDSLILAQKHLASLGITIESINNLLSELR